MPYYFKSMFDELKEAKSIKEMKALQLKSEAYLEPKRATMIKLLKAVNYFRKKRCIRDVQQR